MASNPRLPAELAGISRHLFFSPHYDDIALSTGATVRLLADNGLTPETLVVFGSEPDRSQPLSTFAEAMHRGWGLSAEEVIARRQAEERAASDVLGASTAVLPFRDAIYRGDTYRSDDDLFGRPASVEDELPAEVAASLALPATADPTTRIYAPLAVGHHVDHQHVFRAATNLAQRGWDVWFYEDIPYALKGDALEARLAEIAAEMPITVAARIPVAWTWDRKIDAILSYPSQLATVFRQYIGVGTSRQEIAAALHGYADRVGEGAPAERFWKIGKS